MLKIHCVKWFHHTGFFTTALPTWERNAKNYLIFYFRKNMLNKMAAENTFTTKFKYIITNYNDTAIKEDVTGNCN